MRKFALLLSVITIFTLSAYLTEVKENDPHILEKIETQQEDVKVLAPQMLFGIAVDSLKIKQEVIQKNQNISEILTSYDVSQAKINALAAVSKEVFDVRKLATNKKYTLIYDEVPEIKLKAMIYEPNAIDYVVFNLENEVSVEMKRKEVTTVERSVAGIIQSSLSQTMEALQMSPQLTNRFVDAFAWQVDFQRLQVGDKFKLIFDEKQVAGKTVGIGEIKGIFFEHYGNEFYAVPYDQGDGTEFFDQDGESLRKALLKYPLEFTRISSRYSGSRFHPVQKRYKAHRGTDFAAPKGTPIRSVGDGIIVAARYSKYNGNYVKIKHNATYTTQYLHMSKIASGIKTGMKVKQGQTIGQVGSTGLATGAHLCYRFWKNGVQIDALKVDLPSAAPISKEHLARFQSTRRRITKMLNDIEFKENAVPLIATNRSLETTNL